MNWQAARKAALLRDDETCRRCLRPATDVHHRRPRQMGGTSDDSINYGMANLVSLCRTCHNWIHAHPSESYRLGWLVHSWQSPEDIPIKQEGNKYEF